MMISYASSVLYNNSHNSNYSLDNYLGYYKLNFQSHILSQSLE